MQKLLGRGKLYLDYGPVQMTITAKRRNRFLTQEVEKAGAIIPDLLASLAGVLPLAKQPWPRMSGIKKLPRILRLMTDAVSATQDESLTPMAAVAGAFADIVADFLVDQKATKVLVNNGGDIAIRLEAGESTRIGIAPHVGASVPTHFISLDAGCKVGGVATSGLGGRSFTLGIADAAVAVAKSAVVADACATLIGNYTNVDSPLISRCLARELDPNTDIPEMPVTVQVGQLPVSAVHKALMQGLTKAKQLIEDELILGSVIFVAGQIEMWPKGLVQPLREFQSQDPTD